MRTIRPSEETATERPEDVRLETVANSNPLAMEVKAAFDVEKVKFGITFDVKDEQLKAAKSVLEGRNVLVLLPTGYGKTLCFVIPTVVKNEESPITLIISPLTALMNDQMQCLSKWGMTVAKLEPLPDMERDVINGKYSVCWKMLFLITPKTVKIMTL